VPSISNTIWFLYVGCIVWGVTQRRVLARGWPRLPERVREFARYGLVPCGLWCLDPANVRGWYRQLFQDTDAPVRNPLVQLRTLAEAGLTEYSPLFGVGVFVLFGIALALRLAPSSRFRWMALFGVWPVILMSLSRYPVEARFIGCLVPTFMAAAVWGWLLFFRRLPGLLGAAALAGTCGAFALALAWPASRSHLSAELRTRAPYRYRLWPEDASRARQLADEAERAAAPAVPGRSPLWPTVRLLVRTRMAHVTPGAVTVEP
jgi:hypothetical protein